MINLDTEVMSRFDAKFRVCHYTIERDGKRWTASIPVSELAKHGGNKALKRNTVTNYLMTAMRGMPDA